MCYICFRGGDDGDTAFLHDGVGSDKALFLTGWDASSFVVGKDSDIPQSVGDDIADNTSSTTVLNIGGSISTNLNANVDKDFFQVNLVAGQTYVFTMTRAGSAPALDTFLEIRTAGGALLKENDDGGIGTNSVLMYRATETGTHFLSAGSWNSASSGAYTVTAQAIETGPSTVTTFASNGKPQFSWTEAAYQITREGASWSADFGQSAVVTYSFRADAPATMPSDTTGFSRFNATQIAAAEAALQAWAQVANITFVRVGTGTTGDAAYSNDATIVFGNYSGGQAGASAFAYLPTAGNTATASVQGDVWVNNSIATNANPVSGEVGYHVLMHEIGHALGLSHPGDYDAEEGVSITYAANAEYQNDSRLFTVMSYFATTSVGGAWPVYPGSPQLHDIAAIQRLYGANTSTRSGDTVYGFNSNTGRPEFTITSASQAIGFTVWDGGGNDTLDFSGFSQNASIDLRQEAFMNVGPGNPIYNVVIARGSVIENAIGGSGNDTIRGNAVANTLNGGSGQDTMYGGLGNDVLLGGAGGDGLYGEEGNDEIRGGDGVDTIYGDIGDDTLYGDADLDTLFGGTGTDTLFGGLGNDTLWGDADADTLWGEDGDDSLIGGDGTDTLYGGIGADTLRGGAGNDILEGGDGTDVAEFDVAVGAAAVVRYGSISAVVSTSLGIDRFSSIETLRFSGVNYAATSFPQFRALDYIAGYDDLITVYGLNGDGAVEHYLQYGFAEGRTADRFDGASYLASYTDLLHAFGNDVSAATAHFITNGFSEGRSRDTFNELSYIAGYDDLITVFGLNGAAGTDHWVYAGYSEGRATNRFDAAQYLASYGDLIHAFGLDRSAATSHFITNGFSEGRSRDTFDELSYVAGYDDLITVFGLNGAAATDHWIYAGYAEGRTTNRFDAAQYLASHGDLIEAFGLDEAAATAHFITTGFAGGRSRDAFDELSYIAGYDDLITVFGLNGAAATDHWIYAGYHEGRTTDRFDAEQYLASHGDLIEAFGLDEAAATAHFITAGFSEGRSRDSFDAVQYLANYADLQAVYGGDLQEATRHYILYGYAEGRTDEDLTPYGGDDGAAVLADKGDAFQVLPVEFDKDGDLGPEVLPDDTDFGALRLAVDHGFLIQGLETPADLRAKGIVMPPEWAVLGA